MQMYLKNPDWDMDVPKTAIQSIPGLTDRECRIKAVVVGGWATATIPALDAQKAEG